MMYDSKGREIRPRNGLVLKAGSIIFEKGEWITLKDDHIISIRKERNDLCQSVEPVVTLKELQYN